MIATTIQTLLTVLRPALRPAPDRIDRGPRADEQNDVADLEPDLEPAWTMDGGETLTLTQDDHGAPIFIMITPPPRPGDTDADGTVQPTELLDYVHRFGDSDPSADLNHDGKIDAYDLALTLDQYLGAMLCTPQGDGHAVTETFTIGEAY